MASFCGPVNITTGARFTTYAIEAPRGSRTVGVNGAAARLVQAGDKVIVVAYGQLDANGKIDRKSTRLNSSHPVLDRKSVVRERVSSVV